MKIKLIGFALLANFSFVCAAHAVPVTWFLQDVAFNDGGVATGSFAFDADTATFSDINVTTSSGSILTGEIYDSVLPVSLGNSSFLSFANSAGVGDFTGFDAIGIDLSGMMTNLGGQLSINVAGFALESRCADSDCLFVANPFRSITSGFITTSAVPLPAALPLFLAGIAGLGFAKRKRENAAA